MRVRAVPFLVGIALFLALALFDTPLGPAGSPAAWVAATAALMIAWWAGQAVPLGLTALAPLFVFPLAGVHAGPVAGRAGAAFGPYADAYVLLFLGGMTIAAALQETGLHRRVALWILARSGGTAPRAVLGVLVASAAVSLWISNTAATALLAPIALSLASAVEDESGPRPRFAAALLLACAWGANVGGMGTKIGTAPNAQLCGFLAARGVEVSFLEFAAIGFTFVLLVLPLAGLLVARLAARDAPQPELLRALIARRAGRLRPWSAAERAVLCIFLATAAAWIAAAPLHGLLASLPGLETLRTKHVEAGVAIAAGVLLLVLRAGGARLVTGRALRTMPFEALLLIGGSLALADGVERSGLLAGATPWLAAIAEQPPLARAALASLLAVALSAFASNTATVAILLPLLGAGGGTGATPVLFAATLASSCDFAFPAGTPPNAIVFATGRVPLATMAANGAVLDLAAALLAAAWCTLAVPAVLG